MPLYRDCWAAMAFISFKGIYEWIRPNGIIAIRSFLQERISVHIFNQPQYRTCKVYMDDLLFHGQDGENFVINTRQFFQICREKSVNLSAKTFVVV